MLAEDGAKVVVSDLDLRAVQAAGKSAPTAEVVADVLAHDLDMYASCAMGPVRQAEVRHIHAVADLRPEIVWGAAMPSVDPTGFMWPPSWAGSTQASNSRRATRRCG